MNVAECQSAILSAGYTLGSYRIERFLGQGGFGITYLAHDIMLDLPVAIKEYLPEQLAARTPDGLVLPRSVDAKPDFKRGLEGFIKEARTLARFKHPNIVRIMGVFELNGTAYIVMEYEKGQDLKAILGRAGQISQLQLEQIIGPILDGLEEVHRHGFIHRDIKPANIRIRNDGTPVLLDFGAARHQTQNHAGPMTALVSAGFAPMEQYTNRPGAQRQGPWTDIYALGAVLYYAVTGNAPVDSAVRGSALLNDKPDPLVPLTRETPKGFTPAFCRAVDWAMRFKVSQRPQSLAQWRPRLLQDQLNAAGSESVSPAEKLQSPEQNVTSLHSDEPRTMLLSDSETVSDSFLDLIDQQLAATETTERDGALASQKTHHPNGLAFKEDSVARPGSSTIKGVVTVTAVQPERQTRSLEGQANDASSARLIDQEETRVKDSWQKKTERRKNRKKQSRQKETEQADTSQTGVSQREIRLGKAVASERQVKQCPEDIPWEQEPWEDAPWGKQASTPKSWENEPWEIGDINDRNHRQASTEDSGRVYETAAEPLWLRKTATVITGAVLLGGIVYFSLPSLLPVEPEEAISPAADWVVSSVDTLASGDTIETPLQNDTQPAVYREGAAVAVPDTASNEQDEVDNTLAQPDDGQPSTIENTVVANSLETTGPVVESDPAAADAGRSMLSDNQSLEADRTVLVDRIIQAAEAARQRELERQRWSAAIVPAAGGSAQSAVSPSAVGNNGIVGAMDETPAASLDAIQTSARDEAAVVDSTISDRDMAEVLRKFDSLSLAIMERDISAVKELTMPSERTYTYLDYLFSTFETIVVGVSDIRGSRSQQKITGTIRIREMVRPDGERVPPPSEFAAINVYSIRSGDWSKIHW